jgi:hypothetical protein
MSGTVLLGVLLLLGAIILELLAPDLVKEGFQSILPSNRPPDPLVLENDILSNFITQRGDVGIGQERPGYFQDRRYFAGYADVQRYGVQKDFCRMVTSASGEEGMFFACALAGTKLTSPYGFRTKNASQGFRVSRDDYMRDIVKDGRMAYCRILKFTDGTYQPLCLRAMETGFHIRDQIDPDPPEEIKTLLDFYSGCEMWLRLRDDLLDTMGRTILQYAGKLSIEQTPRPTVTRGLQFNGKDQFVRFGDTQTLALGNKIKLRTLRAWSVWVHFDEFTNNAHIFDFGNGAGDDNIFLGILGKGESGDMLAELRPGAKCAETTVPDPPAGAQWCPEIRPQELLKQPGQSPDGDWNCVGQTVFPRKQDPIQSREPPQPTGLAQRATLQFEIWDKKLRKVQIKVNRAIPLQKWTHIVVTAASADALRPDIQIWVNGNLLYVQEQGFLPQAKTTSNNYLGKSNWINTSSEYELRDELFAGAMFDFRMYSAPLGETKIKRILQWGLEKLGLDTSFQTVSG